MRRDFTLFAIIWALVTVASLAVSFFILKEVSFPTVGAEEAHIIDDAFMVLTYLATPVFGVVIAAMVVAVLRHRSNGPHEDGQRILGTGRVPIVWVAVSSLLCVVVIIYPGIWGIVELSHHDEPGLEINVTGQMWSWTVEYPESGVRVFGAQEMVLPNDETIKINVVSLDILHSFWIPAFRQKIDALPGDQKAIHVKTNALGDPSDSAYRLQCAELCGVGHAIMAMPVRVVEKTEFDAWLKEQQSRAEAR